MIRRKFEAVLTRGEGPGTANHHALYFVLAHFLGEAWLHTHVLYGCPRQGYLSMNPAMGDGGFGDDVADLLDEFFNSTERMVLVAFYSRITAELSEGTAIDHVCRQFESRRTRFERPGTWGLFDPDRQVPGWISLNAFLGPMVAAAGVAG